MTERPATAALGDGLTLLGVAPLTPEDGLDPAMQSAALYGPDPERFWPSYAASSEYMDGQADPLDRWSRRVGGALAAAHGGFALYPFEGPPYFPFLSWAIRTGRAWSSPLGFVVHERLGLWFSLRLAVVSPRPAPKPPAQPAPCVSCAEKPCLTSCPVGAFSSEPSYNVDACAAHLESAEGEAGCMSFGCRARAACPVGAQAAFEPARAAHHMGAFRAGRRRAAASPKSAATSQMSAAASQKKGAV